MKTIATLKSGEQLWGIYHTDREYARELGEDNHRDATLAEVEVDKKRLLSVAKREVLMPQLGSASSSKKARTKWN